MRVRPGSDHLTDREFRIGICHQCDRYGQTDYDARVCKLPDPGVLAFLVLKDYFKRIEYCQRVKEKREAKRKRDS